MVRKTFTPRGWEAPSPEGGPTNPQRVPLPSSWPPGTSRFRFVELQSLREPRASCGIHPQAGCHLISPFFSPTSSQPPSPGGWGALRPAVTQLMPPPSRLWEPLARCVPAFHSHTVTLTVTRRRAQHPRWGPAGLLHRPCPLGCQLLRAGAHTFGLQHRHTLSLGELTEGVKESDTSQEKKYSMKDTN